MWIKLPNHTKNFVHILFVFIILILTYFFLFWGSIKVNASVAPISCTVQDNSVKRLDVLVIDINPYFNIDGKSQQIRQYMYNKNIDKQYSSPDGPQRAWEAPSAYTSKFISFMNDASRGKLLYSVASTITITDKNSIGLVNRGVPVDLKYDENRFFNCLSGGNTAIGNRFIASLNTTTSFNKEPSATSELMVNENDNSVIKLNSGTQVEIGCSSNDGTNDWISIRVTGVYKNSSGNYETASRIGYVLRNKLGNIPSTLPTCDACNYNIDVNKIVNDLNICQKVNNNEIDEVWIFTPKYGFLDPTVGGLESVLVTNPSQGNLLMSHGTIINSLCNTPVPIMVPNYTSIPYYVGGYSLPHYMAHRIESSIGNYLHTRIGEYVWDFTNNRLSTDIDWSKTNASIPNFFNLTSSYLGGRYVFQTGYENALLNPYVAGCGTNHGDPTSLKDYDHGNTSRTASSYCYNPSTGIGFDQLGKISIEKITQTTSTYACSLWGCTGDGWLKYWMQRIPQNTGAYKNLYNNWWKYVAEPELVYENPGNIDVCTCPSGYFYNQSTEACDPITCTNPSYSCGIQNISGKNICDSSTGQCEQCLNNSDCSGIGAYCENKVCKKCEGQVVNGQCKSCYEIDPVFPIYDQKYPTCATCRVCWPCPTNAIYDTNTKSCVTLGCASRQVPCSGATPYCDVNNNKCVSCLKDEDCGATGMCVNGSCNICPGSNPMYLNSSDPTNNTIGQCVSCNDSRITKDPRFCPTCPAGSNMYFDTNTGGFQCSSISCDETSPDNCPASTPWCTAGKCEKCPADAHYDSSNNQCVYCNDNEVWNNTYNRCDIKSCANGGLTCSGATPKCVNSTFANPQFYGKCVECNSTADCSSGTTCQNFACKKCAFGTYLQASTNSCITCAAGQVWDTTADACVTKTCGASTCTTQALPQCASGNCVECTSNAQCTNKSNTFYDASEPYCVNNTCSICPSSSPNYNKYTKTCEAACPNTSDVWNGSICIEAASFAFPSYNYLCSFQTKTFNNSSLYNFPMSTGQYCDVNTPFQIYNGNVFDGVGPAAKPSGVGPLQRACVINNDCTPSSPVCLGGSCIACPVETPIYNTSSKRCEACPIDMPLYDRTTDSCNTCPTGQVYDTIYNSCKIPTCNNGLLKCSLSAPICDSNTNTCLQCLDHTNCGGTTPYCVNNQCVHCNYFYTDPSTGNDVCSVNPPPTDAYTGSLYWDSSTNSYVTPSCTNGGIDCGAEGKICDKSSNKCVTCLSNYQCNPNAPICDLVSHTCIQCPTSAPVYGSTAEMHDELEYLDFISKELLSSQVNSSNLASLPGETYNFTIQTQNFSDLTFGCMPCPQGTEWDGTSCKTLSCVNGGIDCSTQGLICNESLNQCAQCNTSSDCSTDAPYCNNGKCNICPSDKPKYNSITMTCENCGDDLVWFNGKCISYDKINLPVKVTFESSGLAGVVIDAEGTTYDGEDVFRTVTTSPDGTAEFIDLPAGSYKVTQIQPTEYSEGSVTSTFGEVLGANTVQNISLTSTINNPIIFTEGGWTLDGYLYLDSNNNGIMDSGELPITNQIVNLLLNNIEVSQINTDSNGYYKFENLVSNDYQITVDSFPTYNPGIENYSQIVTITSLNGNLTNNFGYIGNTITVNVLQDFISNGIVDPDDIPIANTEITLIDSNNISITNMTDINGKVIFSDLTNGIYTVVESQPDGFNNGQIISSDTTSTIVLNSNTVSNITINNSNPTISFLETGWRVYGKVIIDLNRDLNSNRSDLPISGNKITLSTQDLPTVFNNVLGVFSWTTNTDSNGNFEFNNIPNGIYELTQDQPNDYLTLNSNVLGITVNGADSEVVLFAEASASISGTVYSDTDRNNTVDGIPEELLINTPITIVNINTGEEITISTDGNGNILIPNLKAGIYTMKYSDYTLQNPIIINPGEILTNQKLKFITKNLNLIKTGRDNMFLKILNYIFD